MSEPIRLVFLGCGRATHAHAASLRRIPNVQLSFASRDAARAEAYRRQYGGRRAFGSYADGISDPENGVALIATSTSTHQGLAMASLEAGKHVIVDAPAFLRSTDVQPVLATAKSVRRRVLVAESHFYRPMARLLRRWIANGDFGDVRFVLINATVGERPPGWSEDPVPSGVALLEGGIHWVSFLSNIGMEVVDVAGFHSGPREQPGLSSLLVFRYTNGAVGTLAHSWELPAPLGGRRLSKIEGTAGALTFETSGWVYAKSGRRRAFGFPALRDANGYRAMHEDLLHALSTGTEPQFTFEMAHQDLSLLERAQRLAFAR